MVKLLFFLCGAVKWVCNDTWVWLLPPVLVFAGVAGWGWCWPAQALAAWPPPSWSCTTRKVTSSTTSSSPAAHSSASFASCCCPRARTSTCLRTSQTGNTTPGSRCCRTRRASSPCSWQTLNSRITLASTTQQLWATASPRTPLPTAWSRCNWVDFFPSPFFCFFNYFISPSYISSLPFVFYLMLLCGRSCTLGKGVLHRFYKPVMEQTQT